MPNHRHFISTLAVLLLLGVTGCGAGGNAVKPESSDPGVGSPGMPPLQSPQAAPPQPSFPGRTATVHTPTTGGGLAVIIESPDLQVPQNCRLQVTDSGEMPLQFIFDGADGHAVFFAPIKLEGPEGVTLQCGADPSIPFTAEVPQHAVGLFLGYEFEMAQSSPQHYLVEPAIDPAASDSLAVSFIPYADPDSLETLPLIGGIAPGTNESVYRLPFTDPNPLAKPNEIITPNLDLRFRFTRTPTGWSVSTAAVIEITPMLNPDPQTLPADPTFSPANPF